MLWAGYAGIGYWIGEVEKALPANIQVSPQQEGDWRRSCRRDAVRDAFTTEEEARKVIRALDQLAAMEPFGVFQHDLVPGRYQRLLARAREGGLLADEAKAWYEDGDWNTPVPDRLKVR